MADHTNRHASKQQQRPGQAGRPHAIRNPDVRQRTKSADKRQLHVKEDPKLEPERWDGLYA